MAEDRDYATDGTDGPDWDSGLEDDATGVMKAVGRLIKACREAASLTQAELGAAIGYGEEMVSKVERGIRVPKPAFLDNADRALDARGILSAMKPDVADARYPKKVRDLAKLEADA
ncbi:MAG: helix-turn-helix transcriptional regulator, partial [Streptomyces sp.]|nr:helix-turn-helix transcriptional regulator [Streptomyces sp.]